MGALLADHLHGLRLLRNSPGFSLITIGSAMALQRAVVTGNGFEVLGVRARADQLVTPGDD
jgi:hypothetical protein